MNWQLGTMVCLPTKLLAREKWGEKHGLSFWEQ